MHEHDNVIWDIHLDYFVKQTRMPYLVKCYFNVQENGDKFPLPVERLRYFFDNKDDIISFRPFCPEARLVVDEQFIVFQEILETF